MDARVETSAERTREEPWPLPEGWTTTRIADVVDQLTDGTHQSPDFTSSGVPFVVIGNLLGDRIDWPSVKRWVSPSTFFSDSRRLRPRTGDILYTAVGSYGHAIKLLDDREFMFQRHIAFLRPNRALIEPAYLCYALNSPVLRQQADRTARGVAQKTVTLGSLRHFVVPLAPLAEQRRIVDRIEALLSKMAEGETALASARKGLDTFRRALLKAAVTGELTKDWREANPVVETGHDLLARIAKSRAENAQVKGRSRRAAEAQPLEILETTALPELPQGWVWGTLDLLKTSNQRNGISIAGSSLPPGTKALRLDALTANGLNLDAVRYIPLPKDRTAHYSVNAGDILISRANGSAELVGRAVYVSDIAETIVFPDTIIRYPLGPDAQLGRWIEMAWNSPLGRIQIRRLAKTTAGILKISQEDISKIYLPIPPPAEAAEILRRVSAALAASADTLAILDAEAADAARLKQSILKAAFEGRLVPQDPADEPASDLLARLRAEGAGQTRTARGRRRRS